MLYPLGLQLPALNQNALEEHRHQNGRPSLGTHCRWHDRVFAPSERLSSSPSDWKRASRRTAIGPPALPKLSPEWGCHLQPPSPIPPTAVPWLGRSQLPCPSPLLGLSALHKNHQAEQEQNESWKIRHPVNVCDAASCLPGACSRADPRRLNHRVGLLPRAGAASGAWLAQLSFPV